VDNSKASPVNKYKVEVVPEDDIRHELSAYARRIKLRGYTTATGGNISIRINGDIWISPSGFVLDEIKPEDWVRVNVATGEAAPHRHKPSSETMMHLNVYRARPEVNSVFHSHPPYIIAASLLGRTILPICPEIAIFLGDDIPLVPYTLPMSQLLADAVGKVLAGNNVIVLQSHGLLAFGKDNHEAYYRTELAEETARILSIAYSMGMGEPRQLSPKEITQLKNWAFHKILPTD
jgi:L-fuculose-phosphate aldolase